MNEWKKKKKSIVGEGVRDIEDLVVTWDILKNNIQFKKHRHLWNV